MCGFASIKLILFLSLTFHCSLHVSTEFLGNSEWRNIFELKWLGKLTEDTFSDGNSILMSTKDGNHYMCILPLTVSNQPRGSYMSLSGPDPWRLFEAFFQNRKCVIRVENFWMYELCHGHHIRQFHEKYTDKGIESLEYMMGRYEPKDFNYADKLQNADMKLPSLNKTVVDGIEYAFLSFNMTHGSLCDVTGRNRYTVVQYICKQDGDNQIYSVREITSCEYEVIVFTPVLCSHPAFRTAEEKRYINCYSSNDAPKVPYKLNNMESLNPLKHNKMSEKDNENTLHSSVKGLPLPKEDLADLLEQCLQGGTGWWHFEFCYGKKVIQFHEDQNGSRKTILLGTWNVDKHLLWISKNAHKRPKTGKTLKQISHLYSDGDFCDETQKSRQVEVRLKCKESNGHPNSITFYLLESRVCEYILSVESPRLCSLIESADENGLN